MSAAARLHACYHLAALAEDCCGGGRGCILAMSAAKVVDMHTSGERLREVGASMLGDRDFFVCGSLLIAAAMGE